MVFGDSLPGGFLLQSGNTGHVEHDSEEEKWLIAKLVQLLLEGFLQLHPAMGRGLGLPLEPQPKVMGLKPERETVKRLVWSMRSRDGDEGNGTRTK